MELILIMILSVVFASDDQISLIYNRVFTAQSNVSTTTQDQIRLIKLEHSGVSTAQSNVSTTTQRKYSSLEDVGKDVEDDKYLQQNIDTKFIPMRNVCPQAYKSLLVSLGDPIGISLQNIVWQGTEIAGGSHYRFSFKNSNVNVIIFQALSYNGIIGNKTATIICPDSGLDPIMFDEQGKFTIIDL